MIELESPLFTLIADELRSAHPGIWVASEYVPKPASFPAVFIAEMDNSTYRPAWSNRATEEYAQVMYEVDVFSNLTEGKKAEAKAIMKTVDAQFQQYGFERVFCAPVQNFADATIYRMKARYRAVVSDDLTIYRR